jgi:hypothetical protein
MDTLAYKRPLRVKPFLQEMQAGTFYFEANNGKTIALRNMLYEDTKEPIRQSWFGIHAIKNITLDSNMQLRFDYNEEEGVTADKIIKQTINIFVWGNGNDVDPYKKGMEERFDIADLFLPTMDLYSRCNFNIRMSPSKYQFYLNKAMYDGKEFLGNNYDGSIWLTHADEITVADPTNRIYPLLSNDLFPNPGGDQTDKFDSTDNKIEIELKFYLQSDNDIGYEIITALIDFNYPQSSTTIIPFPGLSLEKPMNRVDTISDLLVETNLTVGDEFGVSLRFKYNNIESEDTLYRAFCEDCDLLSDTNQTGSNYGPSPIVFNLSGSQPNHPTFRGNYKDLFVLYRAYQDSYYGVNDIDKFKWAIEVGLPPEKGSDSKWSIKSRFYFDFKPDSDLSILFPNIKRMTTIDKNYYQSFRNIVDTFLTNNNGLKKVFYKHYDGAKFIWIDGTNAYLNMATNNTDNLMYNRIIDSIIAEDNNNPLGDKRLELKETDYIYLYEDGVYFYQDGSIRKEPISWLEYTYPEIPESGYPQLDVIRKGTKYNKVIGDYIYQIGKCDSNTVEARYGNQTLKGSLSLNNFLDLRDPNQYRLSLTKEDKDYNSFGRKNDILIESINNKYNLLNCIWWVNGYFVVPMIVDEKTVILKNARYFLSSIPFSESTDLLSLIDVRAFQWNEVNLNYNVNIGHTTSPFYYQGRTERKYTLDVLDTIHFGVNIGENHLLLCNGAIVDRNRYKVDGGSIHFDMEKEFVYIQDHVYDGLKEFGIHGTDGDGKDTGLVTTLYPVYDIVQKHIHSAEDYMLLTFSSSNSLKDVELNRSSVNYKNYPYSYHVSFPELQGSDLILIDGVFEPYTTIQDRVIKYSQTVFNKILETKRKNFLTDSKVERIYFISKEKLL